MLLGVVGLNGSGKDTFARYLVAKQGFVHRDLGQEIRNELERLGRNHLDRAEMRALGNSMREKEGADYWARIALSSAGSVENLVITSIRNPAEARLVKSRGGMIVEVFAEQKVRFGRTLSRISWGGDAHGESTFEDFKKKEEDELRSDNPSNQQSLECISMADKRIDNSDSAKDLYKKIDALLKSLAKGKLRK